MAPPEPDLRRRSDEKERRLQYRDRPRNTQLQPGTYSIHPRFRPLPRPSRLAQLMLVPMITTSLHPFTSTQDALITHHIGGTLKDANDKRRHSFKLPLQYELPPPSSTTATYGPYQIQSSGRSKEWSQPMCLGGDGGQTGGRLHPPSSQDLFSTSFLLPSAALEVRRR
ncbi:hypothetical protein EYF80_003136 [Liparis tanakae]|uniref:Uncharacterized protein n=1 Tax=Liparis tanakae TaxID=230148 RepID=A0A4Z2JAG9_9TELE|nr:hypothetical protein EYF80_003136 [Liparis tanakae]